MQGPLRYFTHLAFRKGVSDLPGKRYRHMSERGKEMGKVEGVEGLVMI